MTAHRPLSTRVTQCAKCQQPIVFARTVAGPNGPGGKAMPLDAYPNPDGNVAVRRTTPTTLVARVLTKGETHDTTTEHRAMPHFATCPGVDPIGTTPRPSTPANKPTPNRRPSAPPPAVAVAGPPKRVQCPSQGELPPNTVFIGRGTRWANEFEYGSTVTLTIGNAYPQRFTVTSRTQALNLYRTWQLHEDTQLARRELRGKDVACWCPLDLPCHGDALLEVANS